MTRCWRLMPCMALLLGWCASGCAYALHTFSADEQFPPSHRLRKVKSTARLAPFCSSASGASDFAGNCVVVGDSLHFESGAPFANEVSVHTTQHVVLGMAPDTDYVDDAYREILATCRDGHLRNIETRFTSALSFLSYDNHLSVWAVCQHDLPPLPPPDLEQDSPASAPTPSPAVPAPRHKANKKRLRPHRR